MVPSPGSLHTVRMLDVHTLQAQDLHGLAPAVMAQLAQQMLASLAEQSRLIGAQTKQLDERDEHIAAQAQTIKFKDVKLEKITFELARLKAWRFGAKAAPKQTPRRQALPEHLRRVDHHHEPENTTCPRPDCGQPMARIGEDVSERLDIVPAEFFVHRHIQWDGRPHLVPTL